MAVKTRRVACTRPSTLAKALSDGSGLMPYAAATTLQMLAQQPDLRNRLVLIDPGDKDWRAYKPLHEEAQRRRGKPEAEAGTNIHLAVAAILDGRDPVGLDPSVLTDAKVVLDALAAHGLEPVETEVFVVALDALPEPVAGTRDLLCRDVRTGELVVADIKSAGSPGAAQWRWMEWGIQLDCYAHGQRYDLGGKEIARDQWDRPIVDPSRITEAAPAASTSWGVVVDIVRDTGIVSIHEIDLSVAHRAARLACEVRAMKKQYGVIRSMEYVLED